MIAYGDEFLFEKLPVGTRVIYPPPPLDAARPTPTRPIRYALLHPENQPIRCSRSSTPTCA